MFKRIFKNFIGKSSVLKIKTGKNRIIVIKKGKFDIYKSANLIIFLFLELLIIYSLVAEPFRVSSNSMEPTLHTGDIVLVSKFSYGFSKYSFPFIIPFFKNRVFDIEPKMGDVAAFRLSDDSRRYIIKRVIGFPGDVIQIKDGVIYIGRTPVSREYIGEYEIIENGFYEAKLYKETLISGREYVVMEKEDKGFADNTHIYVVPEDHYFLVGDNRDNSLDSRFSKVGFIHRTNLIGKVQLVMSSSKKDFWKFWEWCTSNEKIIKKVN